MAAYIDLSEKHGHRNDHGFTCGAEFNVKTRRRVDIPDFVREKLSAGQIDEIWWEEARQARDRLRDALSRRYKWIGDLSFVGRGPGWLAIEDTECRPRNWDTISKTVDQHLKSFIKSMEDPKFWRGIEGLAPESARQHATKKRATKKSASQLQHEIDEALARNGKRSHATKIRVPGVGKWNTYAGGTGAAEGKHSYDFHVPEGQYTISPYTARYGRHLGYLLRFAATGGRPRGASGGLWHHLGEFKSPAKAASEAAKHYERGFE